MGKHSTGENVWRFLHLSPWFSGRLLLCGPFPFETESAGHSSKHSSSESVQTMKNSFNPFHSANNERQLTRQNLLANFPFPCVWEALSQLAKQRNRNFTLCLTNIKFYLSLILDSFFKKIGDSWHVQYFVNLHFNISHPSTWGRVPWSGYFE